MNGFSGKDTAPLDYRDLLPFSALAKGQLDKDRSFTPATVALIVSMIRDGRLTGIPASIFRSVPEIKDAIGD